jgi:hypothetical protein
MQSNEGIYRNDELGKGAEGSYFKIIFHNLTGQKVREHGVCRRAKKTE